MLYVNNKQMIRRVSIVLINLKYDRIKIKFLSNKRKGGCV